MPDTWTTRLDVIEALEAGGWTADDNELELLRKDGAVWAVVNDSLDSSLTGPGGWVVEFPSDTPDAVIVAACLAAAPDPKEKPVNRRLRCSAAVFRQPHLPHNWAPQPGMEPVHCPGAVDELEQTRDLLRAESERANKALEREAALEEELADAKQRLDIPHVVVICGSTRFMDAMADADRSLTAKGHIVVKPGCNMKQPHPLWADPAEAEALKARLDGLHRAKIRLADSVLVVGDYVGDSTRAEIEYARSLGKQVFFTHPEVDPDGEDGMCPACDTTDIERCVACGSCRCDRHDDCVRPATPAP